MGFELESDLPSPAPDQELGQRLLRLQQQWQRACETVVVATTQIHALSAARPDDPRLLSAGERLRSARQRRLALAEDMENLERELDGGDIWR